MVLDESSEVIEGQWDGLEKIVFAFEKATIAVGTKRLKDAHEDITPEMFQPTLAFLTTKSAYIEVMIEQFETQRFWKVALSAVEQRGHIILRGAPPTPLEIDVE
jgi:hypothetical protein